MASIIIPGFEYDIFISYRHKDNKYDGWVSTFLANLTRELAATFKEDISIYFDENPHDGILGTHQVEESLKGKLNCLIFIPILSQTYCDTNSFAWRQEFCAFNKLVKEDRFGREIRLANGNVSSRILPVKIHDLDGSDRAIIEGEIGGPLRAVDFIYKEPGVNRPLIPTDSKTDNVNKTDYRNQLNRLANAIKEIVYGMSRPSSQSESGVNSYIAQPAARPKQSIAVMPFTNLSSDPEQEYFSEGIMENIITALAGNRQLRTISRTSMMRYKKTTKSAPEIGAELDVKYILEGGVQLRGNKVRINAQLVDAEKDNLTWSKVFVEDLNDIFQIQSNVAGVVARELHASIHNHSFESQGEVPTRNLEAYDLYLKGRHAFNQWGVEGYRVATEYFKRAIALDPEFNEAYSLLASSYSARMSWNGDLSPREAQIHIEKYLAEAWSRGPTQNDYLTRAFADFFISKDFASAERYLKQAMMFSQDNAYVEYAYSYLLNMMGRFEEASQLVLKATSTDPLTISYFNYQTISLYLRGHYEEALLTIQEALRLYPFVLRFYDFMARIYLTVEKWSDAEVAILTGLRTTKLRPPSMVAYLAIACLALNRNEDSKTLLEELLQRSASNEKGVNIYVVHIFNAMGDHSATEEWLEKAKDTNDVDLIWRTVDPLFRKLPHALANPG